MSRGFLEQENSHSHISDQKVLVKEYIIKIKKKSVSVKISPAAHYLSLLVYIE